MLTCTNHFFACYVDFSRKKLKLQKLLTNVKTVNKVYLMKQTKISSKLENTKSLN